MSVVSYLPVETVSGSAGPDGAAGASIASGRLRMTPGRVVALTLGVPVVAALIGALGLSAISALDIEHYPVSATFPMVNHQLTAKVDGNLTVQQGPAGGSSGRLTGTATYSLVRSVVTRSGSTVAYRCRWIMGDCSMYGTLTVPSQTDVTLTTGGGDVTMGNYNGNLRLNLDGGNLNAGDVHGDMQVNSSGGDVTVTTLDGPVNLTTDGGNVNIPAVISGDGGTVTSDGGDVTMTFTTDPANLTITSNGGNVRLILPHATTDYIYDIHPNGGSSHYPQLRSGAQPKVTVNVESNGGDVTITGAS